MCIIAVSLPEYSKFELISQVKLSPAHLASLAYSLAAFFSTLLKSSKLRYKYCYSCNLVKEVKSFTKRYNLTT